MSGREAPASRGVYTPNQCRNSKQPPSTKYIWVNQALFFYRTEEKCPHRFQGAHRVLFYARIARYPNQNAFAEKSVNFHKEFLEEKCQYCLQELNCQTKQNSVWIIIKKKLSVRSYSFQSEMKLEHYFSSSVEIKIYKLMNPLENPFLFLRGKMAPLRLTNCMPIPRQQQRYPICLAQLPHARPSLKNTFAIIQNPLTLCRHYVPQPYVEMPFFL